MAQQTFSGVPGDFTAGQVLTAADMDKLREFLLYLIKDGDEGDTGETSPLILDLGSDLVSIDGDLGVGFSAPTARLVVGEVYSAHSMPALGDMGGLFGFFNQGTAGGALQYGLVGNVNSDGSVSLQAQRVDSTATAYAMKLQENGGLLGVGVAPSYKLHVATDANNTACRLQNTDSAVSASNSILDLVYTADADCSGGFFAKFADSAAFIGSISCASTSTVAFNTTSDYRIKSNVADLTDAVASVEALRPVSFTFTRDTHQRTHHGFLAHEAAEVYPLAVTGEKDAMRTVPAVEAVEATYDDDGNELAPAVEAVPEHEVEDHQMMDASKLVPLLTAAVQELTARVAALEAAA